MKNIGKIPQLRGITYSRMKRAVEETPTIDAVAGEAVCIGKTEAEPVRHGRWIGRVGYIPTAHGDMEIKVCSCCKEEIAIYDFDYYCPYCGAKMDGGAEE